MELKCLINSQLLIHSLSVPLNLYVEHEATGIRDLVNPLNTHTFIHYRKCRDVYQPTFHDFGLGLKHRENMQTPCTKSLERGIKSVILFKNVLLSNNGIPEYEIFCLHETVRQLHWTSYLGPYCARKMGLSPVSE